MRVKSQVIRAAYIVALTKKKEKDRKTALLPRTLNFFP